MPDVQKILKAVAFVPGDGPVAMTVPAHAAWSARLYGRLAPMGTVDVRPRVSGYITEVKFVDGDLVKKGQPLFIIDPRPNQADYEQAKAELDKADAALKLASSDFDRARQLREKGVTAAGDFDQRAATFQQATGAFQSARAALERAKLDLDFCTVTAPIDGRAGLANVTVGNLVSADSIFYRR